MNLTKVCWNLSGAVIQRNTEPMLIMECMDHGSLSDLLHNVTVTLEGDLLLSMMRDIAQGESWRIL